tara:strand:- start:19183 stop:20853 length:1671 start_codon:yes stop_codon:yes gene_type:complete
MARTPRSNWSSWLLPDNFFGFNVGKKQKDLKSFATPETEDGTTNIEVGGAFGTYYDMSGSFKNESELITKYREMSNQPECDAAIEDIINEAIVIDDESPAVDLELSETSFSDEIKKKIYTEFIHLKNLLSFETKAHEVFRRWYVDGKMYYHMIIDEDSPKKGIQELRYVDSRKMKKIREVIREKAENGLELVEKTQEYYVYDESSSNDTTSLVQGIKVHPDSIAFSTSGLFDHSTQSVISHLHKAIKPLNQLRMMEDAVVIYRISRAPERRIFYIDVGNLPKAKAEQYLRDMMVKHRNKLVYDANTGELKDERKHMSMMEDYWLPRREGGRGTQIETLPGGTNLGELEDIEYFQKKLYKSLNVPVARLQEDTGFSLGRETEITRDELKFSKFIIRLRARFNEFFGQLLRSHLLLRGIISEEDWEKEKSDFRYVYAEDSYYREIKQQELMAGRLEMVGNLSDHIGKLFSIDYVRRQVLKQNDEEIDVMDKEIAKEKSDGKYGMQEEFDTDNAILQLSDEEIKLETDVKLTEAMVDFYKNMSNGNGHKVEEKVNVENN